MLPQYHVVYDNEFETVVSTLESVSMDQWADIFRQGTEAIDAEAPPALSDEWLTQEEKIKKNEKLKEKQQELDQVESNAEQHHQLQESTQETVPMSPIKSPRMAQQREQITPEPKMKSPVKYNQPTTTRFGRTTKKREFLGDFVSHLSMICTIDSGHVANVRNLRSLMLNYVDDCIETIHPACAQHIL